MSTKIEERLSALASTYAYERWAAFEALFSAFAAPDGGDGSGAAHAAVPALVKLMTATNGAADRAQVALLLGLLLESSSASARAACRQQLRKEVPQLV